MPRSTTAQVSPARHDAHGVRSGAAQPTSEQGHDLPYLPSLDGLRAVAIAMVVVYHLRPAALPGGFIGVDVFFVISGFLICAPIIRAVETGRSVSPARFLLRRARRLLPAVFVVVTVTAVAFARLPSTDLHRLRRHALSSLAYSMNWTLAGERLSYTDLVQGASPLRHMWSLAIEEQFYLAVALLLVGWVVVRGRFDTSRARTVVALTAAALAVCSALAMWRLAPAPHDNARAYYGTDTRAQALLVGIVAAAVIDPWRPGTHRRSAVVPTVVAIAVLGGAAWRLNEQSTVLYRGGFLLVAAASAVLVAGVLRDTPLRSMLGSRAVVMIGRLSYSLYLWHWPVIVYTSRRWPEADGVVVDVAILVTTVALAAITYAVVEQPARRHLGRRVPVRTSIGLLAAGAVVAASVATLSTRVDGAERTDDAGTPSTADVPVTFPQRATPSTGTGEASPPAAVRRAVIVGDSMAHTLAGGRVADFPNFTPWTPEQSSFAGTSMDVISIARPACSFLAGEVAYVRPDGTWYSADLAAYCGDWRDQLRDLLAGSPAVDALVVALSNDLEDRAVDGELVRFGTDRYVALLEEFLDSLHTMLPPGTRLVLVAGAPRSPAPETDPDAWREIEMRRILRHEVERLDGSVFVDLGELVCPNDDCTRPAEGFDLGGRSDGLHFSPQGAHQAAAWMAGRLDAALSG
ncbi:MAG: acyltransferase family protein [Ilumatobacteraceae bacterium]